MAGTGGKRQGAGNKEGNVRPKITTYWSQDDIKEYFDWLKEEYKKQPVLAKMVGEQLMGKPVQPIVGGDEDDRPIKIDINPMLTKVYGKLER